MLRNNGAGNYYRFVAYGAGYTLSSAPTGFSVGFGVERQWGGNANQFTVLGVRNASATPTVGAWYTIDATINESSLSASLYLGAPNVPGAIGNAVVANLPLIANASVIDSTITSGGVAIYADGLVDFDTFAVRTPCDADGACSNL